MIMQNASQGLYILILISGIWQTSMALLVGSVILFQMILSPTLERTPNHEG